MAFKFKKLVKYTIINLTKGPECCFTLILHFNYNKCIRFLTLKFPSGLHIKMNLVLISWLFF